MNDLFAQKVVTIVSINVRTSFGFIAVVSATVSSVASSLYLSYGLNASAKYVSVMYDVIDLHHSIRIGLVVYVRILGETFLSTFYRIVMGDIRPSVWQPGVFSASGIRFRTSLCWLFGDARIVESRTSRVHGDLTVSVCACFVVAVWWFLIDARTLVDVSKDV